MLFIIRDVLFINDLRSCKLSRFGQAILWHFEYVLR